MSFVAPVLLNDYPLPSALACGSKNGQLGMSKLVDVGPGGKLEATCARAWNALFVAAMAAGHRLTWTPGGTYRTIENQAVVFLQRFTTDPSIPHQNVTRFYMGQVWYLKKGVAMAATPGSSPHGWGLAIDTAVGPDQAHAQGIGIDDDGNPATSTALDWLVINAPAYGFAWSTNSEPWHIQYVKGDDIPQPVLDMEAFFAQMGA
jgi:LAS superfamily LD-carboxypeptidase LdcB